MVQLIMEYLPQGSLRDYLPTHKLSMAQCLLFVQQICQVRRFHLAIKTSFNHAIITIQCNETSSMQVVNSLAPSLTKRTRK